MKVSPYIVLIAAALAVAACERPFVEPDRPQIEIVSPSLSTVFPNTKLSLQVDADAERGVQSIEVNGDTLAYDESQDLWVIDYALHDGLNELVFAVTDSDNNTTLDTAFAMHGALSVDRNTPPLPSPRGGHTATLVGAGRLVILGGAPSASSDAVATGIAWDFGEFQFQELDDDMVAARTGHTASLLPDGRILILGGSRREPAADIIDLVETVEIFDPVSGFFSRVPFEGDPIRRAYHTASVHFEGNQTFIDLYGGRGDIQYRPQPTFGTRRDLRRFIFRDDSLFAVSPAVGPTLNFSMWGHTQTALETFSAGDDKRFLVAGTNYAGGDAQNVAFVLDYGSPSGITQNETGELIERRTRHAAAPLSDGFTAIFGGYQQSPDLPLNDVEIYSEQAGRFFIFPPSSVLLRRYGLSATKFPDGRILLVGGYFSAGQGTETTSVARLPAL